MSVSAQGEICYAEGSYYSVGVPKASKTVSPRGAVAPEGSLPDESFALPMRERYLRYESSPKLVTPRLPSAAPVTSALPPEPLIDLTPGQIKALGEQEFAVRFAVTPMHALRPAQLMLIDGDKRLSEIAHAVLDRKACKKPAVPSSSRQTATLIGLTPGQIKALSAEEFRARFAGASVRALTSEQLAVIDAEKKLCRIAHEVLNEMESERTLLRVRLPKKLEIFVADQIAAGLYRDASDLISESLGLFQKQSDLHRLRLALERETESRLREREQGATA